MQDARCACPGVCEARAGSFVLDAAPGGSLWLKHCCCVSETGLSSRLCWILEESRSYSPCTQQRLSTAFSSHV